MNKHHVLLLLAIGSSNASPLKSGSRWHILICIVFGCAMNDTMSMRVVASDRLPSLVLTNDHKKTSLLRLISFGR